MKKITCLLLISAFLCFCLSSCLSDNDCTTKKMSLEDFSPNISEMSLGQKIIPVDFIDKYNYSDGYFCYDSGYLFSNTSRERLLLFFQYDDTTYQLAKEYAMQNLTLSNDPVEIYNDYHFYDNLSDEYYANKYPIMFLRFCYNDTNNTLLFLGLITMGDYAQTANELSDAYEAFLKEFYGDWYDFSA